MPPSPAPTQPSGASPDPAPSSPQWGLLAIGLLAGLLVSGGAFLLWDRPAPPPIAIQLPPTTVAVPEAALPTPTPTPAPITVDVVGAVQQPGVYTLPGGARVVDALEAAGGLLPEADVIAVNRAQALYDGAQVYVPVQGEAPEPPVGVSGETRSGGVVAIPGVGNGLVNVNTASAAELEALPGIGPAKAEAIIANRPYHSVDDLDRVPGIGPATLEELRARVTVQ